jgi:excisionase family DNA binding protein
MGEDARDGPSGERRTPRSEQRLHRPSAGPEPLTLSIAEAAAVLGIGVSTAYRLCARGEFPVPVLRIGVTCKVSARRLKAYVDGEGDAVATRSADA